MPIKAPYNFVPLSDEVYFPDWADQISMDIPFSDGLSGTIELQLTAESPIYVRNGHTRADKEAQNGTYKAFSNIANQYFIPATSLKGAIRNVLEIMTFSKMGRIADKRYSIRDLHLNAYKDYFLKQEVHGGWMRKEGNSIIITDHGVPRRISFETLDKMLPDVEGTPFMDFATNGDNFKTGKAKEANKTAKKKYEIAKKHGLKLDDRFWEKAANPNNTVDKRVQVFPAPNGTEGTIVFTGQPGLRKPKTEHQKGTGKNLEFVFDKQPVAGKSPFRLDINEEAGLYEDFCFIHKDSEDWKFWRQKMEKGESVPVFMILDKEGNLRHFGLSFLYRLPMRRVKEFLRGGHAENKHDMAECIFGYAEKTDALRGRVQFSHAFCTDEGDIEEEYAPYLGSPKPTYYPIYLEQNKNVATTMLDKDAKLRGWKRYPIREELQTEFPVEKGQEDNVNPFIPLGEGAKFTAKVRVHNLRPTELGALLTAIQIEGNSHSIGFAKAFGFGRTKIEIAQINVTNQSGVKQEVNHLIETFKKDLNAHIKDATKSEQWKELKSMAKPQDYVETTGYPLRYMLLEEYQDGKRQEKNQSPKSLPRYSVLTKKAPPKQEAITAVVTYAKGKELTVRLEKDGKSYQVQAPQNEKKFKINDKISVELVTDKGKIIRVTYIKRV